ncbi:NADAR family protein [Streptococcus suis]|nr:NADAR family protein [Streptococcus suis]
MENIKFYKINEPFGEFSNFSPYGFFDDSGLYWPTSEHYFQAQKFEQLEFREKIRLLSNPKAAALDDANDAVRNGLGKEVKGTWNSVTSWFGGGAKYA